MRKVKDDSKIRRGLITVISAVFGVCLAFGVSVTTDKSTASAETAGAIKLYQLAPENQSLMESYVFKTASGKLIVIDGGIDGAGKDREPYLPAALRAIAGVGEGEYFEVEAWFLSHAHKDHFNELAKLLNAYTANSNFKINHFYFDFPDFGTEEYPSTNGDGSYLETLKSGFSQYAEVNGIQVEEGTTWYDALNGAVINQQTVEQGLELTIDGIRFEILQTWDSSDAGDINSNSLVLRAWVEDQSVIFLNDLGILGGRRLLSRYGDALKSDLVQMAHHGQAGVAKEVYDAIDAAVHLWCPPLWVWNDPVSYQIGETRMWVNDGEDFTKANQYNIVSCLYEAYPTNPAKVTAWARVIEGMSIELPYYCDSFEAIDGVPDWKVSAETGTAFVSEYGWGFQSEGAFRLLSSKKVWADKFGLAFRLNRETAGGVTIAVVPEQKNWHTDQAGAGYRLSLLPDSTYSNTMVTLTAGGEEIKSFSTGRINWQEPAADNLLCIGKSAGGWSLSLNGKLEPLTATESAKMEQVLTGFEDRVGYLQFENLEGKLAFTFVGIQYGIAAAEAPEGFEQGPVNAPVWTEVSQGELAGWIADGEATCSVQGNEPLPLNGMRMDLRMAHGEEQTSFVLAFTSRNGGEWYTGAYTICLQIRWTPEIGDTAAEVSLLIYRPDTETNRDEPVKITETVSNFSWFGTGRLEFRRSRGTWGIYWNDKALFGKKIGAEGMTCAQYLEEIAPFYEDGVGYFQFYAPAGSETSLVVVSQTTFYPNHPPVVDQNRVEALSSGAYRVGEEVRIDLSQLFSDEDGDELSYFATSGKIEGSIWSYTAAAEENLSITFTCSDSEGSVTTALSLSFTGNSLGGNGDGCGRANASSSLLLLAAGIAAAIGRRRI